MAKIGSKAWFGMPWKDLKKTSQIEEVCALFSCERDEVKIAHRVYNAVKQSCDVGLLHRKAERLKIKDSIILELTTRSANVLRYFVAHYEDLVKNLKIGLKEIEDIVLARDQELRSNTWQCQAVCTIFYYYLMDQLETIQFLQSQKKNATEIVEQVLRNLEKEEEGCGVVIQGLSEIISAHTFFGYSFPQDWTNPEQLDSKSSQNIVLDGRIYEPSDYHCWVVNVSWMLAHLHAGHYFRITSAISIENLKRKTPEHLGELSGFARELALAKKIGYVLDCNSKQMHADRTVKQQANTLSFIDVVMVDQAVETIYADMVHAMASLSTATSPDPKRKRTGAEGIDHNEQEEPPRKILQSAVSQNAPTREKIQTSKCSKTTSTSVGLFSENPTVGESELQESPGPL